MDKIKTKLVFLFFALGLFFIPQISFAQGQVGLDGVCSVSGGASQDCSAFLSCYNGVCLECQTSNDCAPEYSCSNGICLRNGGNLINGFCRTGSQCQSGKCGANNLCVAAAAASVPPAASANGLPGENLSIQDVFKIINGLACWLLRTVGAVMVIFLVWAGLRFMWARGDPAKFIIAKKNFKYALWGILVIMGVYVIIATVANAVGANFSFIPLVC